MSEQLMTAEDFFMLLGALIEGRRAAFRRRCTLAFAVVDAGAAWYVDTGATHPITPGWRRDAQVSVLCNQRTLSDLLSGTFDPQQPEREHLFLWGGDRFTWETFANALSGGANAIEVRTWRR
jgi:hypothetical protein